ncbi:hypothetical protein PV08_02594 [Exophiala spinifera]|uniref:Uncharacterized protein n=1 Tax=Exophiala spinifera TaxID=91928 RepID=A0A0D1YSQ8_9EURO|nr:uncharacterized protein PV08_02594 [Exophiala spinifera]KIW18306.1 hypothetical protein PV08_02594 [Exophiala spinifera]
MAEQPRPYAALSNRKDKAAAMRVLSNKDAYNCFDPAELPLQRISDSAAINFLQREGDLNGTPSPRKQNNSSNPPVLVADGLEDAGKTEVILNVLEKANLQHALIKSRECLTQRHLLSKIFASCISGFEQESHLEQYDRVDSINALLANLRRLNERDGQRKFVVVIEAIDKLKQAGPTLLPALARLGDQVPNFSILLTSSSPKPLLLHKPGVPYVHFPPYTRSEALRIVASRRPSPSASELGMEEQHAARLYAQFAITIYDSLLLGSTSTSPTMFASLCDKLWPTFVQPITLGEQPPGTGKTKCWDFAKLLVRGRSIFQLEGEKALTTTLPVETSRQARPADDQTHMNGTKHISSRGESALARSSISKTSQLQRPPLLKHFPTLVLLSCYLASHTAPKHDILLFSRLSSSSSGTSKKIRRLRQTPTKKKTTSELATPTKSRNKSIFAVTANLGIPKSFSLERLLAILRAIHPHGIPNRAGNVVSDRVYRELGELEKLRLVVRTSGTGIGGISTVSGTNSLAADDVTEEKWRINVGREWVVSMGHVWGMGVNEYEVEQDQ